MFDVYINTDGRFLLIEPVCNGSKSGRLCQTHHPWRSQNGHIT